MRAPRVLVPLVLVPLLGSACSTHPAPHAGPHVVPAHVDPVAAAAPVDLAGHQLDRPHADQVLVAGDSADLRLGGARVQVTVNGPATALERTFTKLPVGALHHYLATFTVHLRVVQGTARLSAADFRLLAIADQVNGGAIRTSDATTSTLPTRAVTAGSTWTGTWTAPFVEGHGELLFAPRGTTRPAALWDFRVES